MPCLWYFTVPGLSALQGTEMASGMPPILLHIIFINTGRHTFLAILQPHVTTNCI